MSIPGIVEIGANEVGIVRKKIGSSLPPGKIIALYGEAGYQADILAPGTHFGYFSLQYEIRKESVIKIPQGEIGLIVAQDGEAIPSGRVLGKIVECNNFQDARAFLENGGEKGRQLSILTTGKHRINTALFTVITAANATKHGMNSEDFKVYEVASDKIGIVTTKDGQPISIGDIAGKFIEGHNKFQDPQQFIDGGGYKGLQEEVLPAGLWKLNPWFIQVQQVSLTEIPTGTVGVVVSSVGKSSNKPGDEVVERGYKGVWKTPLYRGKHPINTEVMDVVIVPTHEITLDWSNKKKEANNYDANLQPLKLRSKDGFYFYIEVTQVIKIPEENAPKMISRVVSEGVGVSKLSLTKNDSSGSQKFSSIKDLVTRVLEPTVNNYFRNSAQEDKALDFHENRSERQRNAVAYIKLALDAYGVQAIDTLINEIDLPPELEKTLKEREIAKEKRKNYHEEIINQKVLSQLSDAQARTREQERLVASQVDIEIAKNEARAQSYKAQGEAESIRQIGIAEADVIEAKLSAEVNALGGIHYYLAKLRTEKLPQLRLPNVLVGQSGLLEAFIAPMLDSSNSQQLLPDDSQPQLPTGNTINTLQLEASVPRCPIIFLLDTSISLSNEYLEGLVEGINTFEEQLSQDDMASRCVEVAMITFGNSAKVVQPFTNAGNFSLHQFELDGKAAIGRGIELSLKIIKHRQRRYTSQNIQHYQPWIFLITGSNPDDNWQDAVRKVKQEVANQKLNFLTVGVESADMNILNQIAPPKFPATKLEDLKFNPLFYGLADLMKRIAHRQEKENLLDGLATTVEEAKSSLPSEQAEELIEYTAKLMSEVSKERPSREEYSSNASQLIKIAKELKEDGQSIAKIVPDLTSLLFSLR